MDNDNDAERAVKLDASLNETKNHPKTITALATTMLSYMWAVAHLMMAIVFFYSGFVQLNDPDWLLWFIGYKLAGLVCVGLIAQSIEIVETSRPRQAAQIVALLAGLSLILHSISQYDNLDFSVYTEEGREAIGLALVCLWMTIGWAATPAPIDKMKSGQKVGAVAIATIVIALCTTILLSIWAVPRFLLDKDNLTVHCQGLGFGPQEPEL